MRGWIFLTTSGLPELVHTLAQAAVAAPGTLFLYRYFGLGLLVISAWAAIGASAIWPRTTTGAAQ